MKCPFCAEGIQDEAILCRFCGAKKDGGTWLPPLSPGAVVESARPPYNFTIRTAAVFFMISAGWEILNVASDVPLFGVVRGGAVAILYHLIYIGLFMAMGIGLWMPRSWGWRAMLWGTVIYTVDKASYLLDTRAREAEIALTLKDFGGLVEVNTGSILWIMNLVALVSLLCWWGFVIYLWFKRDYFARAKH